MPYNIYIQWSNGICTHWVGNMVYHNVHMMAFDYRINGKNVNVMLETYIKDRQWYHTRRKNILQW